MLETKRRWCSGRDPLPNWQADAARFAEEAGEHAGVFGVLGTVSFAASSSELPVWPRRLSDSYTDNYCRHEVPPDTAECQRPVTHIYRRRQTPAYAHRALDSIIVV